MEGSFRNYSLLCHTSPSQCSRVDTRTDIYKTQTMKLSNNYILLTPEILNEFRPDGKPERVALALNSIKYRKPTDYLYKSHTVVSDHVRNDGVYTRKRLGNSQTRRPIKVLVEDITKFYIDHEIKTNHGNNIHKQARQGDVNIERSLESGEANDVGEDAIDSVARANSIPVEHSSLILPEIRAAPCPIHIKREKARGQDALYSTTSHARDVKMFKRIKQHSIKSISIQQNVFSQDTLRGNKMGINVKVPAQYPLKPPTLPKNMPPKEYVMSWLIHGSAPQGSNHFPGIVQASTNSKTKVNMSDRKKVNMSE